MLPEVWPCLLQVLELEQAQVQVKVQESARARVLERAPVLAEQTFLL